MPDQLAPNNRPEISDNRQYRIVLAGNPNSGKTTLFNKLTGLRYKVGNYPGVTVEKKSAKLILEDKLVSLVDLPGIYSLGSFSEDELIATRSLFGSLDEEPQPDLIIAVADASNIERNLYFITQLIDLGIPVVLALTMLDLAESKGIRVHSELLSRELGIPVIPVRVSENKGLSELKRTALKYLDSKQISSKRLHWFTDTDFIESVERIGQKVREYKPFLSKSVEKSIGMTLFSNAFVPRGEVVRSFVNEEKEKFRSKDRDPESYEASARYLWVNKIFKHSIQLVKSEEHISKVLEGLLVHRVVGLSLFLAIMFFVFQGIFLWAQAPMEYIELAVGWFSEVAGNYFNDTLIRSLIVDGIISGVGNVLIFIPQIAILFILLGILEDSGYLARAAYVMDRVMRPVGLQGRSFIPLLSSFACAIPGILSTRTIASRSDRLATILIAPLMSCSARLPVYAVLIAAFISKETKILGFSLQGLMLLGMYVLGVVFAALVSFLLKRTILKGEPSLFLMEMPPLRLPAITTVLRDVFDRVNSFIKNAGTMILACSIILWFLAAFPRSENDNKIDVQHSYAAQIGKAIEPVIRPLGFNWEIGVGLIASFAAREVFVTTLATIYNLDSEDQSPSLINALKEKNRKGEFSTKSAVSLMIFYVFACQCMSTLAVCKRETGSWWWVGLMFTYMTFLAYSMSYLYYQFFPL